MRRFGHKFSKNSQGWRPRIPLLEGRPLQPNTAFARNASALHRAPWTLPPSVWCLCWGRKNNGLQGSCIPCRSNIGFILERWLSSTERETEKTALIYQWKN